MLIKVAQMGGEVHEYSLGAGATVSDALEAADIEVDSQTVHVNAAPASMTTVLSDGDVVTLTSKVEGGEI